MTWVLLVESNAFVSSNIVRSEVGKGMVFYAGLVNVGLCLAYEHEWIEMPPLAGEG